MTPQDAIEIRKSFGMSRVAFARDVLNVPYSTVEKWESGAARMDASVRALYRVIQKVKKLEEAIGKKQAG